MMVYLSWFFLKTFMKRQQICVILSRLDRFHRDNTHLIHQSKDYLNMPYLLGKKPNFIVKKTAH